MWLTGLDYVTDSGKTINGVYTLVNHSMLAENKPFYTGVEAYLFWDKRVPKKAGRWAFGSETGRSGSIFAFMQTYSEEVPGRVAPQLLRFKEKSTFRPGFGATLTDFRPGDDTLTTKQPVVCGTGFFTHKLTVCTTCTAPHSCILFLHRPWFRH